MAYNNYYNQGGSNAPYKGYYDNQDGAVAVPMQSVEVTSEKSWSWCATVWASLALFCCPCMSLCNFVSLMCLSHSYTDHKSGDYERRDYKRRCGVGCLVTSWVLGVLLLIAVIVIVVLAANGTLTGSAPLADFLDALCQTFACPA